MTTTDTARFRVVSWPTDVSGTPVAPVWALNVPAGTALTVGKEGDLPAGIDPEDAGISRVALTVTPRVGGWEIAYSNRNRAVVAPWAQSAVWRRAGETDRICWPRIAVRLVGSNKDAHHWVLLEADSYPVAPSGVLDADGRTELVDEPLPLTDPQRDAVLHAFAEHLAWPPKPQAVKRSQAALAARAGISESAVQARLMEVRKKAIRLGLHEQIGVSNIDYVFLLAAHGYIDPPTTYVVAEDLPR